MKGGNSLHCCERCRGFHAVHFHYIHYNPVKHGYVKTPSMWQYSSIIDVNKLNEYDKYREEAVLLNSKVRIENALREELQSERFKTIFKQQ